jgi:dolichyl-phosphate beta-glucosyltransferase
MKCCLVIPSFKDVVRLKAFLPQLLPVLLSDTELRLVVVDDGSGNRIAEETEDLVERIVAENSVSISFVALPKNLGKGGAIYSGWNGAGPVDWLGFVDADGAVPAGEVLRMLSRINEIESSREDVDGLLASRVKMLGRRVIRNPKRHFVGRSFATLATMITGVSIYDSQCGCKFFRRVCCETVKPLLNEMRFGFDMELLFHLLAHGFRLEEFPVDWTDIPGSKVSLFRDSFRMFQSLLRIRYAGKKRAFVGNADVF